MTEQYQMIAIALLSWSLLDTLIWVAVAQLVLNYGQLQNAIAFGAIFGAVLGLVVGIIGVAVVTRTRSPSVFRWIVLGSMVGAVVAVLALLGIGGYPQRSQADLSLILLGPLSLVIGTALGILGAVALWRWRRSP
ncbi:MAG: hypothetical protein KME12_10795 [Trichocoleus desertorum ATA4-8-CV12]|jgi:uncharacterized membrane protein|nr:hypothetical protein [Trichocoleus desertorum ATA4-8-CV12]